MLASSPGELCGVTATRHWDDHSNGGDYDDGCGKRYGVTIEAKFKCMNP
jgi:hypothetical protein